MPRESIASPPTANRPAAPARGTANGGHRPAVDCTVLVGSSIHDSILAHLAELFELAGESPRIVALLTDDQYRRLASQGRAQRLWLRLLMYAGYPLKLAWAAWRAPRNVVLVVTTNSFFCPLIAILAAGRRPVLQLLYDLFPDALEAADQIPAGGGASRFLGTITRSTQRRAAGVIYLGEFLRAHTEQRWGTARRSTVIPIAGNEAAFQPPEPLPEGTPLRIRYGGNLGHMHDVQSLAAGVRRATEIVKASGRTLEFHFHVSGVAVAGLRQQLEGLPIEITPPKAGTDWQALLRDFPIGMVTLGPVGATVCLPSKLYGMLAGGQAVLAICPLWSDLARTIIEHDAGWVINNSRFERPEELKQGDYLRNCRMSRATEEIATEFATVVRLASSDPALLERKRRNAWNAARGPLSSLEIAQRWRAILRSVRPESHTRSP